MFARDRRVDEADAALVEELAVAVVGVDDDEALRSKSKWRSISGSVPLPIEPKPIITIGPSMRPCRGQSAMASSLPQLQG